MKLSGRPEEYPARRARTLSSARSERKQPRFHGPLQRLLGGVILLMRLRCSAGQLTRREILELTVGEAPKRVRYRPEVMCAA